MVTIPRLLCAVLLWAVLGEGVASTVGASEVSSLATVDLDRALSREASASRARWLFWPADATRARAVVGRAGTVEIARLSRFDDLWILEAPIDSVDRVEEEWSPLGVLRRDESGRAALLESTALVGAGPPIWEDLDLRGDPTSSVAILDSGCDTAHDDLGDADDDDQDSPPAGGDADDWFDARPDGLSPDLLQRVVGWHDVTDDLPQAQGPYDYHYHGTAVASAAFGGGRVDADHRGVAPQGRFVVVKTWNFETRWERWASDFLLGVDWVLEHRDSHRIRTCLVTTVWEEDLGISSAVQQLVDAGIVVVAASGNDVDAEMGYPARIDDVIAVGATTSEGRVASYSTPSPRGLRLLDLVAPGGSLIDPDDSIEVADNEPNDTYRGRVGSSLAAAHVAGAMSLVSQALVESGRPFERSRAQVLRLQSLLQVTAAETPGAESGAVGSPRLDRWGPDDFEGWGLLQIPAAIGAARRVVWPGESVRLTLSSPLEGPASWAARIAVSGLEPLRVDLLPPEGADFDLLLYREDEEGLVAAGRSTRSGVGTSETVLVTDPRPTWYVVVVRRVLGEGEALLEAHRVSSGPGPWPLPLLSPQSAPPTAFDLDGDGRLELLAVNNLSNDDTGHRFYAVDAEGVSLVGFPRVYFSEGDRGGELSAIAAGRLGASTALVAGSSQGEIFAVGSDGQLRFRAVVSGRDPTTTPTILDEGPDARVAVGTTDGVVLLDPAGAVDLTIPLTDGAGEALAAGDVDGDGEDEILVLDGSRQLHLLENDGRPLPGWPLDLSARAEVTAPVLVGDGDGSPPHSIVFASRESVGASWMHRVDLTGVDRPGFPVSVLEGVGQAQMLSPVSVSPLEWGGAPHLLVTAVALENTKQLSVEFRALSLGGVLGRRESLELSRSAFTGAFLLLSQLGLSEALPLQWTSRGGYEFAQSFRGAWTEFVVGQPSRYGSSSRAVVWSPEAPVPRQLHRGPGRQRTLSDPLSAPLVADLDENGRPELYLAYQRGISRWTTPVPYDATQGWTHERGDAARRACYGCEAEVVVDTPPALASEPRLAARPNPFNPRTILTLTNPPGSEMQWELFDARGRRLRDWRSVASGRQRHEEIFEAVDERGRPLASGIYYLRLFAGGTELRTALTLVR